MARFIFTYEEKVKCYIVIEIICVYESESLELFKLRFFFICYLKIAIKCYEEKKSFLIYFSL